MWRTMLPEDIPAVYSLANRVHTLYESLDVFIERQKLCPQGCFVLETETVIGYAISHPYTKGSPPLDTLLHTLPETSCCWYLHDMVIHPEYRRKGYASILLDRLVEDTKEYKYLSLTSVNDTELFWKKHGFEVDNSVSTPTYGSSCYMVKSLDF